MNESRSKTAYLVPDSTPSNGSVRILPADVRLNVRAGETVVDAIRRHGYRTRYSCRRGGCGVCKAELVDGTVVYAAPVAESVLSRSDLADGKCLPCRAEPLGEIVIRLSDRDQLSYVFGSIQHASRTAGR